MFLVAYGLAPDLWAGAVALCLVGAAYIGVLAGCNTTIQLYAPSALRGRMLGIYMMALGILYPIGAMIQGGVANAVGIRTVTVGGAVLLLVVLATVLARRVPANLEGRSAPSGAVATGLARPAAAAAPGDGVLLTGGMDAGPTERATPDRR